MNIRYRFLEVKDDSDFIAVGVAYTGFDDGSKHTWFSTLKFMKSHILPSPLDSLTLEDVTKYTNQAEYEYKWTPVEEVFIPDLDEGGPYESWTPDDLLEDRIGKQEAMKKNKVLTA